MRPRSLPGRHWTKVQWAAPARDDYPGPMKVLLIRHTALTTPDVPDTDRPLPSFAEVKVLMAVRGLSRLAPPPDVILTSPLPRATATAALVGRAFARNDVRTEPALAADDVDGIVAALRTQPRDASVALVGHEPMLGTLLARLLGFAPAERFPFRKGGAALVDLPDALEAPGRLIWFLHPRLLRTLALRSGIARNVAAGNGRRRPRPTSP